MNSKQFNAQFSPGDQILFKPYSGCVEFTTIRTAAWESSNGKTYVHISGHRQPIEVRYLQPLNTVKSA